MGVKEKAKELVDRMAQHLEEWGWKDIAKEQAKICVEEILKSKTKPSTNYTIEVLEDIQYWKDVLTEINKYN